MVLPTLVFSRRDTLIPSDDGPPLFLAGGREVRKNGDGEKSMKHPDLMPEPQLDANFRRAAHLQWCRPRVQPSLDRPFCFTLVLGWQNPLSKCLKVFELKCMPACSQEGKHLVFDSVNHTLYFMGPMDIGASRISFAIFVEVNVPHLHSAAASTNRPFVARSSYHSSSFQQT